MKRFITLLLILWASRSFAQSTTVSATITDTNGQAWKNGTYTLSFRVSPLNPTSTYYWAGVPFPLSSQTIAGAMDSTGHFTVSVPSNTSITPAQSTWDVQVCPIALGNTPCYTQKGLTITGATQDISSSVRPPPIKIDLAHPAYPFVVAYASSEIVTSPLGGIFYNWTSQHYFICEALSPTGQVQNYGTCTSWIEICQFGDSCGGVTTGCTLPGIDTGVLSEHPAGTCYDSLHWTWDDRLNKQNMLLGDGTNSVAGTPSQTFFIGSGNTATNSQTEAFMWGDSNTAGSTGNVASYFINGRSNTFNKGADVFVYGESNSLGFTSGDFVSGLSNNLTTSTAQSIFNSFVTGRSNTLQASAGGSPNVIRDAYVYGYNNNITNLSTTAASPMQFLSIVGEGNSMTQSANTNYINDTHILGSSNTIADTLNIVTETEVIGEQNAVDGASSTLEILGLLNTAHNVTPSASETSTATMVGLSNTITAAPTGTGTIAMTVGSHLTLNACQDCYLFGRNGTTTNSNFIGLGLSSNPEIQVTPSTVTLPSLSSGGTECVQANSSGALGVTGAPCASAGKAILAAPNLCTLGSDMTGLSANTPVTLISCVTTAPSSGCPCRAIVSWAVIGDGSSSTEQFTGSISDGTSNFDGAAGSLDNQITSGYKGVDRSASSPNTYANGASVTFTLTGESDHTFNIRAASTFLSGVTTQVQVTYLSSN